MEWKKDVEWHGVALFQDIPLEFAQLPLYFERSVDKSLGGFTSEHPATDKTFSTDRFIDVNAP
jgi:hypothetical protein